MRILSNAVSSAPERTQVFFVITGAVSKRPVQANMLVAGTLPLSNARLAIGDTLLLLCTDRFPPSVDVTAYLRNSDEHSLARSPLTAKHQFQAV